MEQNFFSEKESKKRSRADEVAEKYGITHDDQHFKIAVTRKDGTEMTVYLPMWETIPVGDSREKKNIELSDTTSEKIEDLIEAHLKYLPEYDEDPGSFELLQRLKKDRGRKPGKK